MDVYQAPLILLRVFSLLVFLGFFPLKYFPLTARLALLVASAIFLAPLLSFKLCPSAEVSLFCISTNVENLLVLLFNGGNLYAPAVREIGIGLFIGACLMSPLYGGIFAAKILEQKLFDNIKIQFSALNGKNQETPRG